MTVKFNRGGVQAVGGSPVLVSDSFTRPADTNAYAAGDAVSDDTTTPSVLTFSDCARVEGFGGTIISAIMVDSANQATKPDFELWVFTASPTAKEDNAGFDPSDAEVGNVVGVFPFDTWYEGNPTSGAGGNAISFSNLGTFPFVCGSSSADLYGLVVSRGAYTPVSGEVFTFTLQIQQD